MALPYTSRGTMAAHDHLADSDPGDSAPLDDNLAAVLDSIYRAEAGGLKSYFSRRLRKEDEPSDYVNETFARLASSMSRELVREPRHYLRRIARNLLFERTRRLKVRAAYPHVLLTTALEPSVLPDQMHQIEINELLETYRRALSELPTKTQEVFVLHRVDELTYKEVGKRLGISIPTVQYHMARALMHLDAALGHE